MQQSRKTLGQGLLAAFAITICNTPLSAGSPPGTGAVLDPDVYGELPRTAPLTRGNYRGLPPRHSLEHFTPTPGDQGAQSSCVGWAVAYAARTIAEARVHELTPQQRVDGHVFSPAYVYNQIVEGGCEQGSLIYEALELLESHGVPLLRDFPYDERTCSQPIQPQHHELAANYRVDGWRALSAPDARAIHVPVRRALAQNRPVVIGMLVPDSFMDSATIRANRGLWEPDADDIQELMFEPYLLYGHAMTVVGYDDERFGGAFRIINSWGPDWGDGGYAWVTYEDFALFVREAYEVIPREPTPAAQPNAGGTLRFVHLDGSPMTATHQAGMTWRMDQPYPSGTRFRTELESSHDGHVYVIGGDISGQFVELFPRFRQTSALLARNETLVMPGPTEDFYTRMDDTIGTDFYVLLFSRGRLDISALLNDINSTPGWIEERLVGVLGERLAQPDGLTPSTSNIGVEAYLPEGAVLPIVVEIEHVAATTVQHDQQPPRIVLHSPTADVFEELAQGQQIYRIPARQFTIRGTAQDTSPIRSLQVVNSTENRFSSRGPFEATVELPAGATEGTFDISATDTHGNTATHTIRVVLDDQ